METVDKQQASAEIGAALKTMGWALSTIKAHMSAENRERAESLLFGLQDQMIELTETDANKEGA